MKIEVVYERNEDFDTSYGPYGSTKVGLKIEDRIIWLALIHNWTEEEGRVEYAKWEAIAKEIVSKYE